MAKYFKGYKFDPQKIREVFKLKDDSELDSYLLSAANTIPRDCYVRIGVGVDEGNYGTEDGHVHMILVTHEDDDKEVLEKTHQGFSQGIEAAKHILTPGIWLNHDRHWSVL